MGDKRNAIVRILFLTGVLAPGLLALWIIGFSQAAQNSVFTVNSTNDTDDGSCDGTHCSLREAIQAANAGGGADTIVFSLAPESTITLAGSQLPAIDDTLTIDGSTTLSLTISGANITRTFQVGESTAVTITSLTIADGNAVYGGGIVNDLGTLTISNTIFVDNYASGDLSSWNGGGAIFSRGPVSIHNSLFNNNSVVGTGGAVHLYCCFNSATVNNSTFSGNSAAGGGGGIRVGSGSVVNINHSTFMDNSAGLSTGGGGILNSSPATVNINGSTFNGNSATEEGGALTNRDLGTVNVINSTFSANSAGNYGGGIRNWGSGLLYIYNSTFSGNSASFGGGIYNFGFLNFANTIIADSTGDDCLTGVETIGFNINNLVEDGSCDPAFSGDPLFGPLQDNGGPTWTHALLSISLAVDNGDNAACAAPPVDNLDQRGVVRPVDGDGDGTARCDIGAYEYDGPPPFRFYLPLIFRP
jgi:CSLREA domain-containing protein